MRQNPLVIRDISQAKLYSTRDQKEVLDFISYLKKLPPYHINPDKLSLNRLCNIEDWENIEIKQALSELKKRQPGIIHRKDWEWALGIMAMRRLNKLDKNVNALGVGSGKEELLFYLANNLGHLYATDLYEG